MADDDGFVALPPGIEPVTRAEPKAQPEAAEPSSFIELPPGIPRPSAAPGAHVEVDSGTHRIPASRPASRERSSPPVFFPVAAPGLPPASPAVESDVVDSGVAEQESDGPSTAPAEESRATPVETSAVAPALGEAPPAVPAVPVLRPLTPSGMPSVPVLGGTTSAAPHIPVETRDEPVQALAPAASVTPQASSAPAAIGHAESPSHSQVDDATRVAVSRPVRTRWRLLLPTGEALPLSDATLLGRDPAPVAGWSDAALQRLRDPAKTVSKTHAALEITGEGELRIHDLGSTNGVAIGYAGDVRREVSPGVPGVLDSGVRLHLGDFTVVVEKLS